MTTAVPGPKVLPGIGTAYSVNPNNLVQSMIELGKKYGEVYVQHFPGNKTVYMVSSQRLVGELTDETRFKKQVHSSLREIRAFAGNGLFTAEQEDPEWAKAHRILMPAFNPVALKAMYDGMCDIADQLMWKWTRTRQDEVVDVPADFTRLTLDTIALCSFSYRFNSFYTEDFHPFIEAMGDGLKESGRRAHAPDLQKKLNVFGQRRFDKDVETMWETVDTLISERRASPSPAGEEDILDVMMSAKDPETGEALSDENLRYQLVTFLIAGHETTSGLLSFTIYELLRNPRVWVKARKIVDEVLGGRFPEHGDLKDLGYIDQILREGLRLYPTAPAFAVTPYESTIVGADEEHEGFEIHPGETALVILPLMHRDPAVWDNPEEFRPERFDFENAKNIPHNAWKPFGNGQRSCIGRAFALQEATMVLALIVQHFDIEFDDPNYQLEVLDGLTSKPKDLNIRIRPRAERPYQGRGEEKKTTGVDADVSGMECPVAHAGVETEPNGHNVQILVGSNAGTSRNFARRLAAFATAQGYAVNTIDLDDAVDNLSTEGPVLICTASYEGLPTDNAKKFVEWISGDASIDLSGVNYAVFGCGNSEWAATFHRIPTLIDDQLAALGANRIVERGAGDVRSDYVGAFEEWAEGLWEAVSELEEVEHSEAGATEKVSLEVVDGGRGEALRTENSEGFVRGVVEESYAMSPTEDEGPIRAKHHVAIRLPEGQTYRTGDYLEILPRNPQALVDRVLAKFNLNSDTRVRLDGRESFLPLGEPLSIAELLSGYVELTLPAGRRHVQALAEACPCPPEKAGLMGLLEAETYEAEVQKKRRSVLDLLEEYPSVQISFEDFVNMLEPLAPRRYSISSSALTDEANRPTLTFTVINEPAWSGRGQYAGIASTYLSELPVGASVPVSVVPGTEHFRAEEDVTRPMILIGAGTGLAPLRAFVEDAALRAEEQGVTPGRSLLFYGCHGKDSDYLYAEQFERWSEQGVVDMRPAFSRHPEQGLDGVIKYVQDRLWQDRDEVMEMVKQGARFYVCGDAERLAPSVRRTITRMVAEAHRLSADDAAEYVQRMEHEEFSYVSDVFD
ncbi:bifunctional cytochrome P450/NADPH--P450 reductase [Corynebacterium sp. 21KM1197]|uniref:bifunctional cytochrome P450/NADPH--P450 reductase n=1 Tax=Corynebacterium sp. 21KM1197 TaxID=2989734 RepID=UPI0029C9B68A|nr:cytochrome P450 [Corynebacterium sp. 21KM1197]WPF68475.1 cytochrome P450 [Corynebacterium sp. 21KM1197]